MPYQIIIPICPIANGGQCLAKRNKKRILRLRRRHCRALDHTRMFISPPQDIHGAIHILRRAIYVAVAEMGRLPGTVLKRDTAEGIKMGRELAKSSVLRREQRDTHQPETESPTPAKRMELVESTNRTSHEKW